MVVAITVLVQHHSWFLIESFSVDCTLSRWRSLRIQLDLCFLDSLPLPQTTLQDWFAVGRAARENVFLPIQRYLFQRVKVWIDCDSMTVALHSTNVDNRSIFDPHNNPFWVCRWNDQVRQSIHLGSKFEHLLKSVRTCVHCSVSFMTTFVSKNMYRKIFVICLDFFWIHNPFLCFAFAKIIFQLRWLNPIDTVCGFGTALYTTCHCVSPATRRLKRKHGSRTLVFSMFRNSVSCVLFPREIRTEDFTFPVVATVLALL